MAMKQKIGNVTIDDVSIANNNIFVHSNETITKSINDLHESISSSSLAPSSLISSSPSLMAHNNDMTLSVETKITSSTNKNTNSSLLTSFEDNNSYSTSNSNTTTPVSNTKSQITNKIKPFSMISIGIIIGCGIGLIILLLLFCKFKKSMNNNNKKNQDSKKSNSFKNKVLPVTTLNDFIICEEQDISKISVNSPSSKESTFSSSNVAIEVMSKNKSACDSASTSGWSFFNHEYFSDVYNGNMSNDVKDNKGDDKVDDNTIEI